MTEYKTKNIKPIKHFLSIFSKVLRKNEKSREINSFKTGNQFQTAVRGKEFSNYYQDFEANHESRTHKNNLVDVRTSIYTSHY